MTCFCNCKWPALSEKDAGQLLVDGGVTSEINRRKEMSIVIVRSRSDLKFVMVRCLTKPFLIVKVSTFGL